jgi:hypothetical protein
VEGGKAERIPIQNGQEARLAEGGEIRRKGGGVPKNAALAPVGRSKHEMVRGGAKGINTRKRGGERGWVLFVTLKQEIGERGKNCGIKGGIQPREERVEESQGFIGSRRITCDVDEGLSDFVQFSHAVK